jgi:hypothetical protein
MGTPAQPDQDQFRFRRAAFYSSLKSKVGLIAAKAVALRKNMNTDNCLIASRAASRRLASSHATSLLNSSLSHHLPRPQPFPEGGSERASDSRRSRGRNGSWSYKLEGVLFVVFNDAMLSNGVLFVKTSNEAMLSTKGFRVN